MAANKKILLYRIDEQDKNVIFVVTEDDEKIWENISDDMQTVLSFDEIFRNITEFCKAFPGYEQLISELIDAINDRGAMFSDLLEHFDDNRLNSLNFFARYYTDTLRELLLSARENIDKEGAFFNTRVLKKSAEYVSEVFNSIRDVICGNGNFDFNPNSDLQAFRLSFDKIIIRGNDRNDIYTVADIALVNFFYDFSFAIHSRKLYVCRCKYCDKQFFGMKNAVCCDGEECKATHQHEVKNAKRRERDNGIYQVYITKISNYIGQQKPKLSARVNDDSDAINRFDKERKVYTKIMRDKIKEYQNENRLPDEDMKQFYVQLRKKFAIFWNGLADEWKMENSSEL